MLKKILIGSVFAGVLAVSPLAAEVFVRIGPPRAVVETRGPMPGRGYVWIKGYHNWEGNRHVWVPGHWVMPPRSRARWVEHRWVRRRGGYVLVEGHWR